MLFDSCGMIVMNFIAAGFCVPLLMRCAVVATTHTGT